MRRLRSAARSTESSPTSGLRCPGHRLLRGSVVVGTMAALAFPALAVSTLPAAAAPGGTSTYTPGPPQLATITNGTTQAPWNLDQGDSSSPAYTSQSPGTVLPTYTPGGATTGSGATAEPNLAVYPGASSGTDGNAPYPSGTVGTPGPVDGYCGPGNNTAETQPTSTPVRMPNGTTLPLAPAYFPHIVRNADGSLTGYFDYRPKDTDEAIVVASSTDNGKDWTYEGEALEQNPGYCPSADTNDDGQGHPNVITVGGVTRLYTLQRPAGDNIGVGMLVHTLSAPGSTDPLAGVPATEKVGIDPDVFATAPAAVGSSATTIATTAGGPLDSPEQLVPGGFVDLTQTPTPVQSSIITCTGVGATSLTGCTTATGTITVAAGDLIEQVIGTVSAPAVVPAGPNKTTGDGGLSKLTITFANGITAYTLNTNAPNRLYLDGVPVYCNQANANPTTKIEDCTTGPAGSALSVAAGDPLTSDPIVPATAAVTTGLVAPDGLVGVLPSYPGAPAGSTIVMYTEKILSYYEAGVTTNSANATFGPTITFVPTAAESMDMPSPSQVSSATPVTVEMGDATKTTIIPVTCTGLTLGGGTIQNNTSPTNDTLTGCSVPTADAGNSYSATSMIGAPGAAVVPGTTLALTGEGSATNTAKLFKNNEDLTVLRVAYTTDGLTFSTAGLANGGIISGASNGAPSYQDVNNPSTTTSPSNLNAYATPGTTDATEMRWVGSAGSIITNPDGSYGLFLSGSWAADGDSDAFNQIFYSSSTDGEHWSEPTTVVSTDYTFAASVAQANALAHGTDAPLGISAYYSGRAYGPSVVQNPNGTLTLVFAGYRLPKPITTAGTVLGTNLSAQYTVGATDPALYRNILVDTLSSATSPAVATATAVSASPAAPVVGQPVTYTATVTVPAPGTGTPTGTVTFSDGSGTLCSAVAVSDSSPDQAACTTTYSGTQTDHVSAAYSGDPNYAPSTGTHSVTVAKDVTTTAVSTTPGSGTDGSPLTVTATVAPYAPGQGTPTGTVTFSDTLGQIAGCTGQTLSTGSPDTATCTFTPTATGVDQVSAQYGGDADDHGSIGSTLVTYAPGPLAAITVSPTTSIITVGGSQAYTTEGYDAYGNDLGSVTGSTTFSLAPDGSCTGDLCTPSTAGPHTVTATDGPAMAIASLAVAHPLVISSAPSTTLAENVAGAFTVTASGDSPVTLAETGALPAGVTFTDAASGGALDSATLAGTPAYGTAGTYPITITSSDGAGATTTQAFTLTVTASAPTFTSAAATTFAENTAGSFSVTAEGDGALTYAETGVLPGGVTLSPAGLLSGTPAYGTAGTYPVTVTVTDGNDATTTQAFTLTVTATGPVVTSSSSATFAENTAGSFAVTADGDGPFTYAVSGLLPTGVTPTAGTLAGTPAYGTAGTYPLTITVTDTNGLKSTQDFTLTVDASAPTFTSTDATTLAENTAGSFSLTADGDGTLTYAETGALPGGVTLSPAGLLSGTPAYGTAGTYPVTVTVTDGNDATATQAFTLTVTASAPTFTSGASTTFVENAAGSFSVTADGDGTLTYAETGALPGGVTLSPAGLLSGTPAYGSAGTYPITVTVTDGNDATATQAFTLTVSPSAATFTSADATTLAENTAGSFSVTADGDGPLTFTSTDPLPSGVSLGPDGTLSGTPAYGTAGTYPLTLTVTDANDATATQAFTLTVATTGPVFTSADATTLAENTAGSFSVTADGDGPLTFTTTDPLPSGVTLDPDGTLSGTPAYGTAGTYPLTITVTDANDATATQAFTLTVSPSAATFTSAAGTTFTEHTSGSFTMGAVGDGPLTYGETGTLPTGVSLSPAGLLSGTPAYGSAGTYPVTVTVTDANDATATQSFTLTVADGRPTFTSSSTATFSEAAAGKATVTAVGDGTITFSVTGTLPTGTTLSSAGKLKHAADAYGSAGTYPVTITATDGHGDTQTQAFTITVTASPPVITSGPGTTFEVAKPAAFQVVSEGDRPVTYTETGALPPGVTFSTSGRLAGKVPKKDTGTYPLTITATDVHGNTSTQAFTLTVTS